MFELIESSSSETVLSVSLVLPILLARFLCEEVLVLGIGDVREVVGVAEHPLVSFSQHVHSVSFLLDMQLHLYQRLLHLLVLGIVDFLGVLGFPLVAHVSQDEAAGSGGLVL